MPRRLREGAVMTHVAAKVCERDKHLFRVGHEIVEPVIAQLGSHWHECSQRTEIKVLCEFQALFGFESGAGLGSLQKISEFESHARFGHRSGFDNI